MLRPQVGIPDWLVKNLKLSPMTQRVCVRASNDGFMEVETVAIALQEQKDKDAT
jgi:hypothetical protein